MNLNNVHYQHQFSSLADQYSGGSNRGNAQALMMMIRRYPNLAGIILIPYVGPLLALPLMIAVSLGESWGRHVERKYEQPQYYPQNATIQYWR